MRRTFTPMQEVDIIAKLSDLRNVDEQHSLLLHSLVEVLIQKGVLRREDLLEQARQLETQLDSFPSTILPDGADSLPTDPTESPIS